MMRHVYVHVPFCARRCSYCDFAIAVRRNVPVADYLASLEGELRARVGAQVVGSVDTIYLGGGTPSLLGGEGVARVLDLVQQRFPAADDAEVTVEANPDDVTKGAVAAWRAAGVNRLSLGAQTFNDDVLTWMHRSHGASVTQRAVAVARDGGITNLSLDLIFALPDALARNFEADVDRLLDLAPDHVSLYGLTVEAGTALGKWISHGLAAEQPEAGYEGEYLAAHRILGGAGFEHYEVSNYAKPGRRARHNSAYWSGAPYLGLGPSSHGFDGQVRRWNARHYAAWNELAGKGIDPIEGSEILTAENRLAEFVYLGLRSDAGLSILDGDLPVITPWSEAGWIISGPDGRMRCTPQGWLRLDALAAALTHHRSR